MGRLHPQFYMRLQLRMTTYRTIITAGAPAFKIATAVNGTYIQAISVECRAPILAFNLLRPTKRIYQKQTAPLVEKNTA
jgi:hypothetical protein